MNILSFVLINVYLLIIFNIETIEVKRICTHSEYKKSGIEIIKADNKANKSMKPIWRGFVKGHKECFASCETNRNCLMAEYNHKKNYNQSSLCKLFNETGSLQSKCCTIYIWKVCNFDNGSYVKGRCNGKWLMYKDNKLQSNTYKYYNFFKAVQNVYQCMTLCLSMYICGSLNYNNVNKTCFIIESYTIRDLSRNNNTEFNGYIWICSKYQDYDVSKTCSQPEGKCRGKFIKANNVQLYNVIIKFKTRSYKICLENCLRYPDCYNVIYSERASRCVIFSQVKKVCTNSTYHYKNSSFSRFTWHCCMTDTKITNNVRISTYNDYRNDSTCACINKPQYLKIKHFNCNAYYPEWKFPRKSECKRAKILCSAGQCFSILNSFNFNNERFLLTYTGYEAFVFGNITNNNMNFLDNNKLCTYYNSKPIKQVPFIISRSSWFAMEYSEKDKLKLKVKYIVIGNLKTKLCLCRSKVACEDQIRHYQKNEIKENKRDLPFNFIISPTGDIFEGSGWLNKYSIESRLKDDFIFIGFLGNFKNRRPLLNSLNSAKKLIYEAVKGGYVVDKYYLFIAPSITKGKIKDAAALYHIIALWPNYKGRRKIDCKIFNYVVLILNVTATIFIALFLLILILIKLSSYHSPYCENILMNMNNDCEYFVFYDKQIQDSYITSNNYLSLLLIDKEFIININNSDFYWLSSKSQFLVKSKHRKKCFCCVKELLKLNYLRNRSLSVSELLDHNSIKYCSYKTIVLICESRSLFYRKVIVIAHLEENFNSNIMQSFIVKFNNKRCFCKNVELNLLFHLNFIQKKFDVECTQLKY